MSEDVLTTKNTAIAADDRDVAESKSEVEIAENAMKYGDFESDVDYTTVLDDFEGPLDLLLHLINTAKINIEDVFVSQVTEQFLSYIEYMKTQPSRDVDKESEYLQIAAQIIYIKSKSMLPPVDMPEEDTDLIAEQQAFIEQLKQREYELIKEETPKLKELETVGYYYKEMDREFSKVKVVYKDFTVSALLEAFAKLMLKNESLAHEKENIREIPKDSFTVEEKVNFIRDTLVSRGTIKFEELFSNYSKNEIITTFQAMLEMLKHQYIMVEQTSTFGEIDIKLNPDWDLKDDSSETFDEYN
ncbi:MAG TPA: segregation/condensation protein A [Candidatus Coproplasma stercoripullorum]|uniref:Segregation and condensation protein A n=1 Tax=Candidatus Coproplasma stercoripullorum TaxID=2840751 RepID=A0A9D1AGA7_9FIRM|nr:segregation/condensation protein A [Candidatus Coproplasma stercoripullorum]